MRPARPDAGWIDRMAATSPPAATTSPPPPSASVSQNTWRCRQRTRGLSLLASKAQESSAAAAIQSVHLASDVGECHLAILVHERVHLRTRSQVRVLVALEQGPVEVRLPLPSSLQH